MTAYRGCADIRFGDGRNGQRDGSKQTPITVGKTTEYDHANELSKQILQEGPAGNHDDDSNVTAVR